MRAVTYGWPPNSWREWTLQAYCRWLAAEKVIVEERETERQMAEMTNG